MAWSRISWPVPWLSSLRSMWFNPPWIWSYAPPPSPSACAVPVYSSFVLDSGLLHCLKYPVSASSCVPLLHSDIHPLFPSFLFIYLNVHVKEREGETEKKVSCLPVHTHMLATDRSESPTCVTEAEPSTGASVLFLTQKHSQWTGSQLEQARISTGAHVTGSSLITVPQQPSFFLLWENCSCMSKTQHFIIPFFFFSLNLSSSFHIFVSKKKVWTPWGQGHFCFRVASQLLEQSLEKVISMR